MAKKRGPEKMGSNLERKDASNLSFALYIISGIILFAAIAGGVYFVIKNEHTGANTTWIQIIRARERASRESALILTEQMLEMEKDEPGVFILHCERARIQFYLMDFESSWSSLETCWELSQLDDSVSNSGQLILDQYCRKMYMRQPMNVGERFGRLVLHIAEKTSHLFGYYMAGHSFSQDGLWEECEQSTAAGLALISDDSSLGLRKNFHIMHSAALMEQQKYSKTISFYRKISSDTYIEHELWETDVQVLEYVAKAMKHTSHSETEIDNAIYYLQKKLKNLQTEDMNDFQLQNYRAIHICLSELYRNVGNNAAADLLSISAWEEAWHSETQSVLSWNCAARDSHFVANFAAESDIMLLALSTPLNIEKMQFHSNLEIISNKPIVISSHLEKSIHAQHLFGYSLSDAVVQLASLDRHIILVATDCKLHGFANQMREATPSSYSPYNANANMLLVENAFLLHWKPSQIDHWVIQCLPKLQYLVENDWMGQWDATVLLPYSQEIKEYVDLLMIEEERITWVIRGMTYNVKNLSILDYKEEKDALKQIDPPHPPTHLLNSLRENLIGEALEVEMQDIILVVASNKASSVMDISLVEELQKLADTTGKMGQIQRAVFLDIEGSIYHQIFAYKRARVVISDNEEFLGNAVWMSPRATIIRVVSLPVTRSHTLLTAAKLKLDYKVIPEDIKHPEAQRQQIIDAVAGLFQ